MNIVILMPARIHIDVDLNNRLEFILEEYDYILKDEKDIKSMLEKIDNYVDRKDDFSWSSLIERSAPTYFSQIYVQFSTISVPSTKTWFWLAEMYMEYCHHFQNQKK